LESFLTVKTNFRSQYFHSQNHALICVSRSFKKARGDDDDDVNFFQVQKKSSRRAGRDTQRADPTRGEMARHGQRERRSNRQGRESHQLLGERNQAVINNSESWAYNRVSLKQESRVILPLKKSEMSRWSPKSDRVL
jgi:hypothetical protein